MRFASPLVLLPNLIVPCSAGALKLVGEMMPWEAASQFVFTQDNHNSVLGIRNQANAASASSLAVTMQSAQGRHAGCWG